MNLSTLKETLSKCKTDKQATKAIYDAGYSIIRDNTAEHNTLDVWLDDFTRVYKAYRDKCYILQTWSHVNMQYSGIPTFFATGL